MAMQELNMVIDEVGVWLVPKDKTIPRVLLSTVYVLEDGGIKIVDEWPPLRSTRDRDLRALATKALYWLLNLIGWRGTWQCRREGFCCEWVYPYGFVPEAMCPRHD